MTLTERDFQRQVTELAELRGWEYLHLRPARTADSWRTPVQGSLGKGWPDLVLARGSEVLAVELKSDRAKPTPEQVRVLSVLEHAGIRCAVWRPADWERIEAVLR